MKPQKLLAILCGGLIVASAVMMQAQSSTNVTVRIDDANTVNLLVGKDWIKTGNEADSAANNPTYAAEIHQRMTDWKAAKAKADAAKLNPAATPVSPVQ